MEKLKVIRLCSKEERRFKQGHPWVYSNELQDSPKAVEPGELVELRDAAGDFLAYGFGNPNSLIAFRTLSRKKVEDDPKRAILSPDFFADRIGQAQVFRSGFFGSQESYRLVYGEADGLPGLIIDRFVGSHPVYVVQPHAYGMDLNLDVIISGLAKVSTTLGDSAESKVILRRDSGSREREGLSKEPTEVRVLRSGEAESADAYRGFSFQVSGLGDGDAPMTLKTDLIGGQKTGFFFDQLQNVRLVQSLLAKKLSFSAQKSFRVLDLCCYVGQWSAHLARVFAAKGLPVEVTAVDASESALRFAEQNVKAATSNGVSMKTLKTDVLEPMPSLKDAGYDVVIADPPAFIKNRKSIPQGKHAYVNLFTTAIQKTAPGGLAVFCSCSQLLSAEDMKECLSKAARRSGRLVRFIAQGSPSVDHFIRLEFSEGYYLKCWVAEVSGDVS